MRGQTKRGRAQAPESLPTWWRTYQRLTPARKRGIGVLVKISAELQDEAAQVLQGLGKRLVVAERRNRRAGGGR